MSHDATSWAFKQRGLKPATWRVLAVLADRHCPASGCWVDLDHLAEFCEISRPILEKHLYLLERKLLIQCPSFAGPKSGGSGLVSFRLLIEDPAIGQGVRNE
ncbi:hypothetical protein [Paracoccus sp. TOH]|uniref:hypothetical protein n=1 Tax=Paracoccus sp. TOH TaxID=1263728 RepID=UPI0025B058C8|nr:hypothetical protein [Paracoccus sp. TOH]WJS83557.1 hypothetical protein NBE95_07170 [Paracoccus sp. TOH]